MSLNYASVSNIPQNTETNVLTFTTSSTVSLSGFTATGDAPGKFVLRIGGTAATGAGSVSPSTTYRTSQTERTAYFVCPTISVASGTNIYINVINEETDGAHEYEATLIYS